MLNCYAVPEDGGSSVPVAKALAQGFGGSLIEDDKLRPGAIAMFGSPRRWWGLLQPAIREGRPWLYVDHGYFGRGRYYRVTRNAYQHDGHGESDGKRFAGFGLDIAPWKKGRHIVVCPPDEAFAKLMGFDAGQWRAQVDAQLSAHTDRLAVWRSRLKVGSLGPLRDALKDAHALVTYTSNAAVEALLFGVPVFCTGPCAAASMGLSDLSKIESPRYPDDRKRWAGVLADNQWTLEEIRNGAARRMLGEIV